MLFLQNANIGDESEQGRQKDDAIDYGWVLSEAERRSSKKRLAIQVLEKRLGKQGSYFRSFLPVWVEMCCKQ